MFSLTSEQEKGTGAGPKIPLKDGLMPTIEYFEEELISETAIKEKGNIG